MGDLERKNYLQKEGKHRGPEIGGTEVRTRARRLWGVRTGRHCVKARHLSFTLEPRSHRKVLGKGLSPNTLQNYLILFYDVIFLILQRAVLFFPFHPSNFLVSCVCSDAPQSCPASVLFHQNAKGYLERI